MGNFDDIKEWELNVSDIHRKYRLGDNSDAFEEIKGLKPIFAFDYISLNQTSFCFNSKLMGGRDFHKMLKSLKSISKYTYETINTDNRFHFHEVKWEDVTISKADFEKCIYEQEKVKAKGDITPYQFKLFQEARVFGFIYKGVFYMVMLDRNHNGYKRKDRKRR